MTVVTPDIHCYADVGALVEAAAHLLAKRIARQLEERGECRLAFAGGNSPRPVYQRLAQADLTRMIEWTHVHVFWGDERCVPLDDEASNYRMAYSALLSHVPVIESNVHRIEVERGSIAAAQRYAEILGNEPLDLVLLGMGATGTPRLCFRIHPILRPAIALSRLVARFHRSIACPSACVRSTRQARSTFSCLELIRKSAWRRCYGKLKTAGRLCRPREFSHAAGSSFG